jgi:hypothetical protein
MQKNNVLCKKIKVKNFYEVLGLKGEEKKDLIDGLV